MTAILVAGSIARMIVCFSCKSTSFPMVVASTREKTKIRKSKVVLQGPNQMA